MTRTKKVKKIGTLILVSTVNFSWHHFPVLCQHKKGTGNKLSNDIFQGIRKMFCSSITIVPLSNEKISK